MLVLLQMSITVAMWHEVSKAKTVHRHISPLTPCTWFFVLFQSLIRFERHFWSQFVVMRARAPSGRSIQFSEVTCSDYKPNRSQARLRSANESEENSGICQTHTNIAIVRHLHQYAQHWAIWFTFSMKLNTYWNR